MADIEIRKRVVVVEEIFHEGGPPRRDVRCGGRRR